MSYLVAFIVSLFLFAFNAWGFEMAGAPRWAAVGMAQIFAIVVYFGISQR